MKKLIDEKKIERRVSELAAEIGLVVPRDVLMVGVLKGTFVFMADLIRALGELGHEPQVDFLRLSSYGEAKESSGEVRLVGALPEALTDRSVLLVDDIVDTGISLAHARDLLRGAGAESVRTCTLLDKPSRREVEIRADFVGFEIEDVFVVGYGIDFAEKYRHLTYIAALD